MPAIYSVKATAQLTGLNPHTLRAWERRHATVTPLRNEKGRRFYSQAQVDHLQLLVKLVALGHSISQLSGLSAEDLKKQLKESKPSQPKHVGLKDFLNALSVLDLGQMKRLIVRARLEYPVQSLVLDLLSPLLTEVGKQVSDGTLNITQEHALSALLRNQLGEILSQIQRAFPPHPGATAKLVFSTPEGELHEFGILLAAILAGIQGHSFRYLGPNLPAAELGKAATLAQAKIIILGAAQVSEKERKSPILSYFSELQKHCTASIWIGGPQHLEPELVPIAKLRGPVKNFRHLSSLAEFDQALYGLSNSGSF